MSQRNDPAPTPNVGLLRRTLAHIENHPEEWNQETWRCGTTACFAGHAAMLDGGEWASPNSAAVLARDGDPIDRTWRPSPGDGPMVIGVDDRARHVLGLTEEQADELFCSANSLDDLREQVAELTGGAQ